MPNAGSFLRASDTPNLFAWSDYTPNWTCSGTAPSLGNGTLTGRYIQIGKLVVFSISFAAGSTTTFGTNLWRFDLPVTAGASQSAQAGAYGMVFDASATTPYAVVASLAASGTLLNRIGFNAGSVTNLAPMTWAVSDSLTLNGVYESA